MKIATTFSPNSERPLNRSAHHRARATRGPGGFPDNEGFGNKNRLRLLGGVLTLLADQRHGFFRHLIGGKRRRGKPWPPVLAYCGIAESNDGEAFRTPKPEFTRCGHRPESHCVVDTNHCGHVWTTPIQSPKSADASLKSG